MLVSLCSASNSLIIIDKKSMSTSASASASVSTQYKKHTCCIKSNDFKKKSPLVCIKCHGEPFKLACVRYDDGLFTRKKGVYTLCQAHYYKLCKENKFCPRLSYCANMLLVKTGLTVDNDYYNEFRTIKELKEALKHLDLPEDHMTHETHNTIKHGSDQNMKEQSAVVKQHIVQKVYPTDETQVEINGQANILDEEIQLISEQMMINRKANMSEDKPFALNKFLNTGSKTIQKEDLMIGNDLEEKEISNGDNNNIRHVCTINKEQNIPSKCFKPSAQPQNITGQKRKRNDMSTSH